MPDELEQLRLDLAAIGARRKAQNFDIQRLATETAEAVRRARGKLSTTEVADLVGLERTTLYRVYGGGKA
jgi:hypothetical protein